jgi:HSP20 family protein
MSKNVNPYRTINDLQRFWNEAFSPAGVNREAVQNWEPNIDIYETESGDLVLLAELPGMKEGDFKISSENNVLTISGDRKWDANKEYRVHRRERPEGLFQRSFSLPSTVDINDVNAAYKNGILSIRLPKKVEARPRQIPVTVK